jgi:cytochrome c-type biogenesis protein CcmH
MVMTYVFFALMLVAALALTAWVSWPVRRGSPALYGGILVTIPVLAFALYQILGTPAAIDAPAPQPADVAAQGGQADSPESLSAAIEELKAALEREPNQPEGWALLARSHAAQGEFEQARDAYARALQLAPDEPVLIVETAQARAQADPQNRFDDESVGMLRKAIAIQPENQRARWFLGIAQRQRGEDAEAARTWESLLPQVDARTAASLRPQIDEARAAAGLAPLPPAAANPPETAGAAHAIAVKVSLDPDFASRVRLRGDTTVFVIARIPGGPPMPVAAVKHSLQDLPLQVTLDDSNSPMPTQKLSSLEEVEVFARLSASGNAMRQDGDIDTAPVRVKLPTRAGIELVLGKQP